MLLEFSEEHMILSHIRLLKVFVKRLTGSYRNWTKDMPRTIHDVLILEWQRLYKECYHSEVIIQTDCFYIEAKRKRSILRRMLILTVTVILFGSGFARMLATSFRTHTLNRRQTYSSIKEPHQMYCYVANNDDKPQDVGNWGSDSIPIVLDSATTRTITQRLKDLVDPQPFKSTLRGIGKGMVLYKGKVRWKVRDDEGRIVVIADNNAYYAPEAPYRLLCPHSWRETHVEKSWVFRDCD